MVAQIKMMVLIIGLTLLSGIADSHGFVHAAKIWEGQKVIWSEVTKSTIGFASGILLYYYNAKFVMMSP